MHYCRRHTDEKTFFFFHNLIRLFIRYVRTIINNYVHVYTGYVVYDRTVTQSRVIGYIITFFFFHFDDQS